MAYPPDHGEEMLKWKWNRCMNDALLKSATGASLGFIASIFFARGKGMSKNLTMMGLGGGLGFAWYTCEQEMQKSLRVCGEGKLVGIVSCEECKKNMEERRKKREERLKELEKRKERLEKERMKELKLLKEQQLREQQLKKDNQLCPEPPPKICPVSEEQQKNVCKKYQEDED